MSRIIQSGSFGALTAPGAYVQVVPPQIVALTGVPSGTIGVVGTASWGPKNSPQPFGDMKGYAALFGPVKARKYDMGTQVATSIQVGANDFLGVRVTDGTDTAAAATGYAATVAITTPGTGHVIGDVLTFSNGAKYTVATVSSGGVATGSVTQAPTTNTAGALTQTATTGAGTGAQLTFTYTTGATFTSKWTGTLAAGDTVAIGTGSQSGSYRITITRANYPAEVFDNVGAGLTANAAWVAIATAINSGLATRGFSDFIVAAAGASTVTPVAATYTLTGGADGSGVTASNLLGSDSTTRTGMYALRSTNAAIGILADADDNTTWTAQGAFSLVEGVYMVITGPAGQTVSAAITAFAGLDNYGLKRLVGDWVTWNDVANGLSQRLVSPQGFAAGRLATLGPQESGLNKPIYGIIATQTTTSGTTYSDGDVTLMMQNGLDVIASPSAGGDYFGLATGRNGSSAREKGGDNYTRLINYIAKTILRGVGRYIGQIQTADERRDAKASLDALFETMAGTTPPMISNPQGEQPWLVTLNATNNPDIQAARGIQVADVKVQFGPIIEIFLINVEGGQTVVIPQAAQQLLAA